MHPPSGRSSHHPPLPSFVPRLPSPSPFLGPISTQRMPRSTWARAPGLAPLLPCLRHYQQLRRPGRGPAPHPPHFFGLCAPRAPAAVLPSPLRWSKQTPFPSLPLPAVPLLEKTTFRRGHPPRVRDLLASPHCIGLPVPICAFCINCWPLLFLWLPAADGGCVCPCNYRSASAAQESRRGAVWRERAGRPRLGRSSRSALPPKPSPLPSPPAGPHCLTDARWQTSTGAAQSQRPAPPTLPHTFPPSWPALPYRCTPWQASCPSMLSNTLLTHAQQCFDSNAPSAMLW